MTWIDLALIADEKSLSAVLEGMSPGDRSKAISDLSKKLSLSQSEVETATLRILIERVRPFALPQTLWARPITSSDDPSRMIVDHFKRHHIHATELLIQQAMTLYLRFIEGRAKISVTAKHLEACGYRCEHCGLAFCDEDLARHDIESPFGLRGRPKRDPLKPHWNREESHREPTIDHIWPVSLYGGNEATNLRVLCKGCNAGKEDFLAKVQMRPFVGLPRRPQLAEPAVVPFDVFYAQIGRSGICSASGKQATETELTIELVDPLGPHVLDNLKTVESRGM